MCGEFIRVIKDVVLIIIAITGAIVAVKGLTTWEKQLKGRNDYDLARKLLISLFKYRDAIDRVRHPIMSSNEMAYPTKEQADTMTDEQIRFVGTSSAYQARWDKVREIRSDLYVDLLDAEALWEKSLKEMFEAVFILEHELSVNIRQYLEIINPNTHERTKDAVEKIFNNKREIMYDESDEEPDEFKQQLTDEANKIKDYLQPKLSR